MEITVDKDLFKEKLSEVSTFVSSGRTDMPITKGILMTAKDNQLVMDASNFIHGCKVRMDTKVITPGELVIEGKKFHKLIKTFTGEEINLKLEGHKLKMTDTSSDYNTFTMLTLNGPDKFPTLPTPGKKADKYEIKKDDLLNIIRKVGFAADDPQLADDNKKTFSKMIFFNDDLIYATNTQKFGAIVSPVLKLKLYLPKNSGKYFRDLSDEFTLYVEDDIYYVQDNDMFFMVKIESCTPPDQQIRKILQKPAIKKVTYSLKDNDRKKIIAALRQLKILNDYVVVYATEETLWMSGVDYDYTAKNEFHTSIKGIHITPDIFEDEIMVTFEIRNLIQTLTSTTEPEIVFQGSFYDNDAFLRVFEGDFQAVIQRMIGKHEEKIVKKIKERNDNN
jgi:DNA polymerase III sliding clamp (beta) subunit (PCNA family)